MSHIMKTFERLVLKQLQTWTIEPSTVGLPGIHRCGDDPFAPRNLQTKAAPPSALCSLIPTVSVFGSEVVVSSSQGMILSLFHFTLYIRLPVHQLMLLTEVF